MKYLLFMVMIALPLLASATIFSTSAHVNRASTQYFTAADNATLEPGAGDMTLEGWFNFASTTGVPAGQVIGLLGKSNATGNQRSYRWALANNTGVFQLELTINSDGTSGTNTATDVNWVPTINTWYHIVVVYNHTAGSSDTYVATSTGAPNPSHVQIGTTKTGLGTSVNNGTALASVGIKSQDDGVNTFDGNIFLARMWTTARTVAQMNAASCTMLGTVSSLGAEWPLDNTLTPVTGLNDNANTNTLTNVNTATWTALTPPSCATIIPAHDF